MKKIYKTFLICLIFTISSCSKDIEDRIVGTWSFSNEYQINGDIVATSSGSYIFYEDHNGIAEVENDDPVAFKWEMIDENILEFETIRYTNILNEKDKQEFEMQIPAFGHYSKTTMTRKE